MSTTPYPWDDAYIVEYNRETPADLSNDRLVLYTIPQDPPPEAAYRSAPSSQFAASYLHIPIPELPIQARFPVQLPKDVDPAFRQEVLVGGEIGLQLSTCCALEEGYSGLTVLRRIATTVDDVSSVMDHLCYGKYVWVERAWFPGENMHKARRPSPKHRVTGFPRSQLLTYLVEQQYRHWSDITSSRGEVQLGHLIGQDAAHYQVNYRVSWDSLYLVAIRRRRSKASDGSTLWFPELEIRIP
ncbi:hypothetical protein C8Q70DRAFT_1088164 [Cubamyces menziesii]|uniref:Uncharacterized protein n=1 Tax=Trametes cubensis TaxID=1111947 RepID=A0AAD7U2T4_9APHY|nr:hypothetical protein C8Q70DRAFT_1088164 [Cubamyces menziesii]KAJ8494695.1 hypothetical protein ONZ51_g2178 [Trametes cubensis]